MVVDEFAGVEEEADVEVSVVEEKGACGGGCEEPEDEPEKETRSTNHEEDCNGKIALRGIARLRTAKALMKCISETRRMR